MLSSARVLAAVVLVPWSSTAFAQGLTFVVDPSGGGDFTTIQAAVDAALHGDTIELVDGDHTGCVDLGGRSLTIDGEGSAVRIVGGGSCAGAVVYAHDAVWVELRDVTVTSNGTNRCVMVFNASALLDNVTVEDCGGTVLDGGGIRAVSAPFVWMRDSVVRDSSGDEGGGIYVGSGGTLVLEDSTVTDNDARLGAGVYTLGRLIAIGSDLLRNNASDDGGGVWVGGSQALANFFDDCTLDDNTATDQGGAIAVTSGPGVYLDNAWLSGNRAAEGGAVHSSAWAPIIAFSTELSGNTTSSGRGAAIRLQGYGWAVLDGAMVQGNTAVGDGGGLSAFQGSVFMHESTLDHNTGQRGGGLSVEQAGMVRIIDSVFDDNVATETGAGARMFQIGTVHVTGSDFLYNTVGDTSRMYASGGGLFLLDVGQATLTNNFFCQNATIVNTTSGWSEGGGLILHHTTTTNATHWVYGNVFVDGYAQSGAAASFEHIGGSGTVVGNNDFLSNWAEGDGAVHFWYTDLEFANNIVAFSQVGHGATGYSDTSNFTYNDWYQNSPQHLGGQLSFDTNANGNTTASPLLTSFSDNTNCFDDSFVPALGSPVLGAGSPSYPRQDGSPSDIGAAGHTWVVSDQDGDGNISPIDCDDLNPIAMPGAPEWCNGEDDDCDGSTDEAAIDMMALWVDADGDGYGNEDGPSASGVCDGVAPQGYSLLGGDCDDGHDYIHMAHPEWCDGLDNDCDLAIDESCREGPDADDDGSPDYLDCDDLDPDVHPGAVEDCDPNVDLDCDGDPVNDALPMSWWPDADGDGEGDSKAQATLACDAPDDTADNNLDCDDDVPEVNTTADEVCDTRDNDCDTLVDDDDAGVIDQSAWFPDFDQDGHGDEKALPTVECFAPGALWMLSSDDCDDDVPSTNPAAPEVCNAGIDDDCDGVADDGDPSVDPASQTTWYVDQDLDGYGWAHDLGVLRCVQPVGRVATNDDCYDVSLTVDGSAANVHWGANEVCNSRDDDCDGDMDDDDASLDASTRSPYWPDLDEDGFGDEDAQPTWACTLPDTGKWSEEATDCADDLGAVHPGAVESCNGVDDDCDGTTDESGSFGETTFYRDADGDGFGNEDLTASACSKPVGYVRDFGDLGNFDCDDADSADNPVAREVCGGDDDDCDGLVDDEDDDVEETLPWYPDADEDGFGDESAVPAWSCVAAGTDVDDASDCDDLDGEVHPDATETCNDGVDDDCDGLADEEGAEGETTWHKDADGDGFPSEGDTVEACSAPEDYLAPGTPDCDDLNNVVYPGADEVCNGFDDDCDKDADEGLPTLVWHRDLDGDTFGSPDTADEVESCSALVGYVANADDCDDGTHADVEVAAQRFPGNDEVCSDGIDQDCDGSDPTCEGADEDGDGYCAALVCTDGSLPGDCDETSVDVHPGLTEDCNDVDDDCNGIVDDGLSIDLDQDGYTAPGACHPSDEDDCVDYQAGVHPGADEVCDGVDQDCDGQVDEGLTVDADKDGYMAEDACTADATPDCDDEEASVNPAMAEVEDNDVDDDCDGDVDEVASRIDDDGDGYCEDTASCDDGTKPGDCDDADASAHLGAVEVVDGIDQDCDGVADNASGADVDGDGYTDDVDCNDFDISVRPGAPEGCNGLDNDCDGIVAAEELDLDHDSYRICSEDCDDHEPLSHPYLAENCADGIDNDCDGTTDEEWDDDEDGWTTCAGDCADRDGSVFPGASEQCNGRDDDCDGSTDEDYDVDLDGLQDCNRCAMAVCDCDDYEPRVRRGFEETCGDGLDNDCDGTTDQALDRDNDGWNTCSGDCDDVNPFVGPGMPELCGNGVDDDCDGSINEGYDPDEDGVAYCEGDCGPDDSEVLPGAEEYCDGIDNDCSGVVDDDWPDLDGDEHTCDDCAEGDSAVHPEAEEVCGNAVDDNCDGEDAECEDLDTNVIPDIPMACWCDAGGASSGSAWVLLAALGASVGRRRRS